jgi:hypothetical protein
LQEEQRNLEFKATENECTETWRQPIFFAIQNTFWVCTLATTSMGTDPLVPEEYVAETWNLNHKTGETKREEKQHRDQTSSPRRSYASNGKKNEERKREREREGEGEGGRGKRKGREICIRRPSRGEEKARTAAAELQEWRRRRRGGGGGG